MAAPLLEALQAYARQDCLPMHMPGHKRKLLAPYLEALSAGLDITEIDGFDNLHDPQGILAQAQCRAAALWGSDESYFLVGGSSAGILAGIYAATNRGEEILLSRNAHKSVFHAIELGGLIPRFLMPRSTAGVFASVTPKQVADAIAAYPKVKLVLITSPTYEGVISDVASIARICHEKGIPLMVDEAHGAHLGLGGGFPDGAVAGGADLVVQSLHKTLPSLTQTAILHRTGTAVPPVRLRHALSVFQSSSPSYLLMASIDGCVSLLQERPELLARWRDALAQFDEETAGLCQIAIPFRTGLPSTVFAYDPGKLVLSGCSGYALADELRHQFHIELEMAAPGYALAMTGMGDTGESCRRLAEVLKALDGQLPPACPKVSGLTLLPELVMSPGEARGLPMGFCPVESAAGQIAGEYVWAYPPGIPLVIPGERITPDLAAALQNPWLHSTYHCLPERVAVVKNH